MKKDNFKIEHNLIIFEDIQLLPQKLIRRIQKFGNSACCYQCGKLLSLQQLYIGRAFCSQQCSKHSKLRQKHRTNTNLEKYGCITCMQLPQYVQKMKHTNLQKYGVQMPIQNQQIREKIQKTNLKKYGQKIASKNKTIKAKIAKSIQSQEVQAKIKQSCTNRFGVDHPSKSKEILQAKRQTCLNRYGVISPAAINVWDRIQSWKSHIIPLFSKEQYYTYETKYKWKCVKCGNQFQSEIYSTYFCQLDRYMPRCLHCFPKNKGISNPERQLKRFCKEYFPQLKSNFKQLIKPYQLDIVIPQIRLALQFNGIYWHSLQAGCQSGYHLMKTQMCQKQGYRLIHIWEDQWKNNKEEIKKKLINIFTNNEIIDYSQHLDRCWYSTLQFKNYQVINAEILIKNNYHIENCGYLKPVDLNK